MKSDEQLNLTRNNQMSNLDDKLETIEVWFDVNIGHGHCPPNETPENCKYLELKQAIKDCFKEWVVEVLYWLAKYKEWEMVKTEVLLAEFERQRNQGEKTDE